MAPRRRRGSGRFRVGQHHPNKRSLECAFIKQIESVRQNARRRLGVLQELDSMLSRQEIAAQVDELMLFSIADQLAKPPQVVEEEEEEASSEDENKEDIEATLVNYEVQLELDIAEQKYLDTRKRQNSSQTDVRQIGRDWFDEEFDTEDEEEEEEESGEDSQDEGGLDATSPLDPLEVTSPRDVTSPLEQPPSPRDPLAVSPETSLSRAEQVDWIEPIPGPSSAE